LHDKRYSVFISSTFEDLKEERQAVQDVIISSGDFPVQMESFPAADEDQFAFIRSLIDTCDYYVLIVGGRYGKPSDDGLSYTEKEYRYAVSVNIPVLVMLHGDRGNIPVNKSEESVDGKRLLEAFVGEVQKSRLRKTWTTRDGLKLAVREALDHAKATKPRVGWVRGDSISSIEALEELNEVRKQNAKYREAIGHLEVELTLPAIPPADAEVEIDLMPVTIQNGYQGSTSGTYARLRATWITAFPIYLSNLKWRVSDWGGDEKYYIDEDDSLEAIGAAFAAEIASFDTSRLFRLTKASLDRLADYYIEVGLMSSGGGNPFTDAAARFARRHRINGGSGSNFTLVKGEITKVTASPRQSDLDDEIPF
jgi:hypothetical protein